MSECFSTFNGYEVKDAKARREIEVERARINQLATLPEGSTTGDAELQDIRVGFDGTQYETAGDAVRAQIGSLEDDFSGIADFENTNDNLFDNVFDESGYIDPSTGAEAPANGFMRTSKYYPISLSADYDAVLNLKKEDGTSNVTVLLYDEEKNYIGYKGCSDGSMTATFAAQNGYFRLYKIATYAGNVYVGQKPFSGSYAYGRNRVIKRKGLSEEVKNGFVNAVAKNTGNLFDNNFGVSGYIDPTTGSDAAADAFARTGSYYKIEKGTAYFAASEPVKQVTVLFYDNEKNYLKYYSFVGASGQCIVDQDGYFRAYREKTISADIYLSNYAPGDPVDYACKLSTLPLPEKKRPVVVNFGDSIIGNTQDHTSVSAHLSRFAEANVYNFGFGGCRMSVHTGSWDLCSMYRLADCIYNGDFSQLVAAAKAQWSGMPDYFRYTAPALASINFADVDVITISYGTNDYREPGSVLDDPGNKFNTATVCGALRYSIKQIQRKYPHIKILVTTPIFRTFFYDGTLEVESNSDSKDWGSGNLLEYAEAIKAACKQMKVPCLDLQNESQLNEYTRLYFYPEDDGTHPNEKGRKRIAEMIGNALLPIL